MEEESALSDRLLVGCGFSFTYRPRPMEFYSLCFFVRTFFFRPTNISLESMPEQFSFSKQL
jgi:hypothetical protein